MSWARAATALAAALIAAVQLAGCAALSGPPSAAPATPASTLTGPVDVNPAVPTGDLASAAQARAKAQSVGVQIEAPADLKTLLERNLDLVRLGGLARDDVDDSEWSRLIDATPAQVRELLQTEGYFAPQVTLQREPRRAAGDADTVHLKVEPGVRARISRVTIEVEGELERDATEGDVLSRNALEQLRKAWGLPVGSNFRNPAWSQAKAAALARLRAAGYATATWGGTGAEVDTARNEVRLFLVADSGPLFRYGELQIEGLVTHDTQTVSNLANASLGAPVTDTLLLDFQDRLQKSGLFENISVTLDPDPLLAAHARITARLTEAPLQTWIFGVGVSANTGARASVAHTYRRVLGYAASAHNKLEYGQLRKAWDGDVSTHPGPSLYRNFVGGAIEQLTSDTDIVLAQRLRVGRAQDGQRIERTLFLQVERSLRKTLDQTVRTNAIATSINYNGVWRDLDSVVLPTQGWSFTGQLALGHSHGSNADPGPFSRLFLRLTGYEPIGRSGWYSQGRVELGQVFLRPNGVVPEPEQFRAGGDDSVRGYAYRSLGPLVDGVVGSGNSLVTLSAELARPILASMPSLWGAVFLDAGNADNSFARLRPAVGLGVGVRWRSPAGPLRLDYAYGRETRKARLHFSVGIAF